MTNLNINSDFIAHPEAGELMIAKITRNYNHAYYCQLDKWRA